MSAGHDEERPAAEARYHEAQRRHFEQYGRYFDPQAVRPDLLGSQPAPRPRSSSSGWSRVLISLAVVFTVFGLVLVGLLLAFINAMNSWASNK